MNRKHCGYFFFLFLNLIVAQESYRLSYIKLSGNENTDADIIKRELLFNLNEEVMKSDVEFSIDRIRSLDIFNCVNYKITKGSSERDTLHINVSKKLNWLIKPILEFYNDDASKDSYGLSFKHKNLFGRNILLKTNVQLGFRDKFSLLYGNPWFGGKLRLRFFTSFDYIIQQNQVFEEIENTHILGKVSFGKGFNFFSSASITFGFQEVDFGENKAFSASKLKKDQFLSTSLNYSYTTLNFQKFPTKGFSFFSDISYYHDLVQSQFNHYKLSFAYKRYIQLASPLVYAFSISNSSLFKTPAYYQELQFGENRLIRGNDAFGKNFGSNRFIARQELRFVFIENYPVSINLPLIASFLQNMNTKFYSYLWQDSGQLYQDMSELTTLNNYKSGYGVGFALIFPYVQRMSLEFGTNLRGYSDIKFLLTAFF